LSDTRVKLTVEIPFADLKPYVDKAYKEIAGQVSIPGFRKGKVPALVIDQRFGRGLVLQEAINDLLPKAYSEAVAEAKVVPLLDPDIEITKLEDGDVVEFTAEVDIRPDFELPDFSTLQVTVPALADVDAEVASRIELLRERFATVSDVDRAAQDGDQVTIDLVASQDGEPIPDGTSEGVTYVIGSGGMLDGLDEAVTGLKSGQSAKFASTLVGGELEGQPAEIEVKVQKVLQRQLPEVDDEFASMVSQFDTAAEMRADLEKSVAQYERYSQANQARNLVIEELVKATRLELPEKVLASEVDARTEQINDQLARAGLTLERYLERADEEAKTPEEFWAKLAEDAAQGLKAQLVLDKVAESRDIPVEQDDVSRMIVQRAMESGQTPEQVAQHMMEHNHLPQWAAEIRRGKAVDLIVAEAKITDDTGAPVDLRPDAADGADEATA
jgi:trigger factor